MRDKMIKRRKELNLTQKDMSEKTGLSRSAIASYEAGIINPSFDALIKLKKGYETEKDEFFLDSNVR